MELKKAITGICLAIFDPDTIERLMCFVCMAHMFWDTFLSGMLWYYYTVAYISYTASHSSVTIVYLRR
jgi:hypothetical protein